MIACEDGFFRVAAATPAVSVADVEENLERIEELVQQAAADGCGAVCFPELALTAYTCGDLFRDEALLSAAERGLARLMEETQNLDILCAVGLPVPWEGALYNCAAVFHKGKLLGLPAKRAFPITLSFTRPGTSPLPQRRCKWILPGSGFGWERACCFAARMCGLKVGWRSVRTCGAPFPQREPGLQRGYAGAEPLLLG